MIMKKVFLFLFFLPCLVHAQWLNVGNTLQRTSDGFKYRSSLGSPGYVYWYSKPQIDSIFALHPATISATTPLFYNSGTGAFTIQQANTSQSGFLSSTDWNIFNNKQNALGFTPYNATNPSNYISLSALSATSPLSYNSATGVFSISQATTSTNGWLSATNWNTFNGKQNAITTGSTAQYFRGDLSLATFPTDLSSFSNSQGYALINGTNTLRTSANFGQTASEAIVGQYIDPGAGDNSYTAKAWISLKATAGQTLTVQVTFTYGGTTWTKYFAPETSTTPTLSSVDFYALPPLYFRITSGTTITVSTTVSGAGTILYESGCTIVLDK